MDRSSAVSIRRRGAPESTKAKYPAPQSQPIQPLLGVAFTTTSRQIKRASNSPQQESCWPKDGAKIEIRWSTCPIGARKNKKTGNGKLPVPGRGGRTCWSYLLSQSIGP
jgi:hypothetical protein